MEPSSSIIGALLAVLPSLRSSLLRLPRAGGIGGIPIPQSGRVIHRPSQQHRHESARERPPGLDRGSGRGVASATFDSVEAMERTKDLLHATRATGRQEARPEVLDTYGLELAVT